MIFEICAIVATILLTVLTIYIVQTLREVQKSLKHATTTIAGLELEMAALRGDVNKMLISSTELVQNVNSKISDLAPLFQTVHQAGDALNAQMRTFNRKASNFRALYEDVEAEEKADISESFMDIIDLAKVGIKLYQQIKKRK